MMLLLLYVCAPLQKGAHTYNNRSIILFHPLSVEILAIPRILCFYPSHFMSLTFA